MTNLVILTHNKWKLALAPEIGGSIAELTYDGQHLMRKASQKDINNKNVFGMSCFPLAPYSNRIYNGEFTFGEIRVKLPPNMGTHPHPLHGQGWQKPWNYETAGHQAVLHYRHTAHEDGWPWEYETSQMFFLTDKELIVTQSLQSLSNNPMPYGLGLHPYFPRPKGTWMKADLGKVWIPAAGAKPDDEQIPDQAVAVPPYQDFSKGLVIDDIKLPGGRTLDDCYDEWNGLAEISWPERRYNLEMRGHGAEEREISLTSPHMRKLVVYAPPGADYFCAEGVTNMTNGFNWIANRFHIDSGIRILMPHNEIDVTTRFTPKHVLAA
ncbi:MAG: aldose 1-epimerase [Alphaproteobacteria bacterium]|nr:aldose 1-epimerase [Alphaproteobacteria bacterium]